MNMLNKFWNTSSRPEGWLGRINLHFMNLVHTPMAKWNLSLIDWQPDWTVLDIGCGGGKNLARLLKLCPQGKAYGIDISEESVKHSIQKNRRHIGTRCFVQQGDVQALPYDDATFDCVTAYETVYFWQDLPKAFAEVFRVLRPQGTFTFSYGKADDPAMHYWETQVEAMHLLPLADIRQLLTVTGFSHIQLTEKNQTTVNFRASKPS